MKLSADPEDLSLKLRKLFPKIEERGRGGNHVPHPRTTSPRSPSSMGREAPLRGAGRQVEATASSRRMSSSRRWRRSLGEGSHESRPSAQQGAEVRKRDPERSARTPRGNAWRWRAKVTQLNDRIRDLNQKLLGTGWCPVHARTDTSDRFLQALIARASVSSGAGRPRRVREGVDLPDRRRARRGARGAVSRASRRNTVTAATFPGLCGSFSSPGDPAPRSRGGRRGPRARLPRSVRHARPHRPK